MFLLDYVTFGDGSVSFDSANFGEGDVFFTKAKFGKGNVYFVRANFGERNVYFTKAKFGEGDVFFDDANFGEGDVSFSETNFGDGDICFNGVEAEETTFTFHKTKLLHHDELRFSHIKRLEIHDCIIERTLDLKSTNDSEVVIEELSFQDSKNLGQIFINWETAKDAIAKYRSTEELCPEEKTAQQVKSETDDYVEGKFS